jgi:hypothetical protein
MSFWDLSDGESAKDTDSEYEIPSGNLEPIPDGSSVLAMVDEAKWDDKDGAEYISLRWSVLAPEEYKNRKIFQKLWVTDDDPNAKDEKAAAKKRDKARRMLAAVDANAGGKLTKKEGVPTDETLSACLTNKPMTIKCMLWEMPDREKPGEFIRGNWIAAVAPKSKGVDVKEASAPKRASAPAVSGSPAGGFDDEIPFAPCTLI